MDNTGQPDLQRRLGLHANDYRKLEELALESDRTIAAEIRRAIREYLQLHAAKEVGAP